MNIMTPQTVRVIKQYDFTFDNESILPVPIDEAAGDSITFFPGEAQVHLSRKPSPVNPSQVLQQEDYVINLMKVIWRRQTTHEITLMSPEAKAQWDKTIQEMSGSRH